MSAVQLLAKGECPEHLQKEFLRWLIEEVCSTYDLSYRTEPRDHALAEGRRFVGLQVVKMLNLDASKVRRQDDERSG